MKIVNSNDVSSLDLVPKKGSFNVAVKDEARKLDVGAALVIDNNEWFGKVLPFAHTFAKDGKSFSVRTLADKSGYAIIRKA